MSRKLTPEELRELKEKVDELKEEVNRPLAPGLGIPIPTKALKTYEQNKERE